jgi:Holliday junction resolvase RusA-like endonuclease
MRLRFDIEPIQQARPRATRFGRGIRLYDPPKVARYKRELALLCRQQYHGKPLEGELSLKVAFFRPVQKSISKIEHVRRISGAHRPVVKPDLSNYLKSFEDALNGILWTDDAMIVHEEIDKFYSDHPHIVLEVKAKEV